MGRNHALTVPQIRQAAQMYAKGMSRREVAAEFGVSEQAVKNGLALLGVALRNRSDAQRIRQVRASSVKPPHYDVGRWVWLNPANADQWKTREVA